MSWHPCFRALARFLSSMALVGLVGLVSSERAFAEPPFRPNIVLIIADDLGWPHTAFMGDPHAITPNLDALAASGTVFRQGQLTASVCAPSLRTFLGGVHSREWDRKGAALEEASLFTAFRREVVHFDTLPRELERQGYLTWEGGKMWSGTYFDAGFTHGLATAVGSGFAIIGDDFGRTGWESGEALDPLRDFLDKIETEPFFLWFAPSLPHSPFDAPQEFRQPYELMGLQWYEIDYYANVSWLDALVGALLDELEDRGEREDTLFVFATDNGTDIGFFPGFGHGKATIHELGFRTPILFNWPGHVPAGVTRDDLASSLDVMPTILDYAGTQAASGLRGASLKPAIESGDPLGRDKLIGFHDGGSTIEGSGYWVRTPTWRYHAFEDGREELFAIAADPFESNEVSDDHPDEIAQFRADVAQYQVEIEEGMPALAAAGRLSDGLGDPIAGAELQLYGVSLDGDNIALRSLTAVDGHFRFHPLPRGTYVLSAGRRVAHLRFDNQTDRISVELPVGPLSSYMAMRGEAAVPLPFPNTSMIHGTLRTNEGDPIEGAELKIRGKAGALVRAVVRTAANGEYRFENLPPGEYRMKASTPRGYRKASASIVLAPDTDFEQNLIAARSGGGA